MKKTLFITFTILCAIGFSLTVNATTFDISIEDVESYDLSGFTVWFEVGDDFTVDENLFSTGSAIPDAWIADTNLGDIVIDEESGSTVFKIGYCDLYAALETQDLSPMSSGSLFSFEYDGTIIDYFQIKLPDLNNTDYYGNGTIEVGAFDENSLVLTNASTPTPTPIPSAIFLLGGGLFGMLGIRKKIK